MIFCPATPSPDETAQMIYGGWMAAAQGAEFSVAPADGAKIGLVTKCKGSVSD